MGINLSRITLQTLREDALNKYVKILHTNVFQMSLIWSIAFNEDLFYPINYSYFNVFVNI